MAYDFPIRLFDNYWTRQTWEPLDDWFERPRGVNRRPTMLYLCKRMFESLDVDGREEMRKLWQTSEVQLSDKSFDVSLDVTGYDPKELDLKVDQGYLLVKADHEETTSDGHYSKLHFMRRYKLPDNVNLDEIKSSLDNSGRTLRINAPLMAVEQPKEQELDVPKQESVLPKQQSNLPKQESDVSKQKSGLPKQESVLPKQQSNIPKQGSDLPKQESNVPVEAKK